MRKLSLWGKVHQDQNGEIKCIVDKELKQCLQTFEGLSSFFLFEMLRNYDQLRQIATLTSSLGANQAYERNEFGELLNFKARQGETENHFVSEH